MALEHTSQNVLDRRLERMAGLCEDRGMKEYAAALREAVGNKPKQALARKLLALVPEDLKEKDPVADRYARNFANRFAQTEGNQTLEGFLYQDLANWRKKLNGGTIAEHPRRPKVDVDNLKAMKVAELRELATEVGAEVPKKAKKAELVSAIAETAS